MPEVDCYILSDSFAVVLWTEAGQLPIVVADTANLLVSRRQVLPGTSAVITFTPLSNPRKICWQ